MVTPDSASGGPSGFVPRRPHPFVVRTAGPGIDLLVNAAELEPVKIIRPDRFSRSAARGSGRLYPRRFLAPTKAAIFAFLKPGAL